MSLLDCVVMCPSYYVCACVKWSVFKSYLKDLFCSYEQAHFTVTLSGKSGLWWIGLRARGGSTGGVDYIWDNDLPLTFTHWDKDQPGTDWRRPLTSAGQC